MDRDKVIRLRIAALIYTMTNAVLFGIGLITVLTVPSLNQNAPYWIPVAVLVSFVLAAPIAWFIAPRLRARFWHARPQQTAAATETRR